MVRRSKVAALLPLPPYASYSSWVKLLEALLARPLPSAVDESYLASLTFSESSLKALRSALRFLGLIGIDYRPTKSLERLVEALHDGGTARAQVLKEIISQTYRPLFSPDFDLKSTTTAQLRHYFSTMGARGQIQQKCSAFFLNLARDAGLELPPHLVSRPGPALGQRRTALPEPKTVEHRLPPPTMERRPWALASSGELGLLLAMFPKFDIDWPEDKKQRWLRDFTSLMEVCRGNGQG